MIKMAIIRHRRFCRKTNLNKTIDLPQERLSVRMKLYVRIKYQKPC
jgi:hypothetical protein